VAVFSPPAKRTKKHDEIFLVQLREVGGRHNMNNGNQPEPTLDTTQAEEIASPLREYVRWLLSDARTLEV
jgi:hypothetical protein